MKVADIILPEFLSLSKARPSPLVTPSDFSSWNVSYILISHLSHFCSIYLSYFPEEIEMFYTVHICHICHAVHICMYLDLFCVWHLRWSIEIFLSDEEYENDWFQMLLETFLDIWFNNLGCRIQTPNNKKCSFCNIEWKAYICRFTFSRYLSIRVEKFL